MHVVRRKIYDYFQESYIQPFHNKLCNIQIAVLQAHIIT